MKNLKLCEKCKKMVRERTRIWAKENPEKYILSLEKSKKRQYWKYRNDKNFKERKIEWQRNYYRKNKEKIYKKHLERTRTPEVRARRKVAYAISTGRLVRPENCSKCLKHCKPQAHHPDYMKPLDVLWLCVFCHKDVENNVQ